MNASFYKTAGTIIAPFRYVERELQELKRKATAYEKTFQDKLVKIMAILYVAFLVIVCLSLILLL